MWGGRGDRAIPPWPGPSHLHSRPRIDRLGHGISPSGSSENSLFRTAFLIDPELPGYVVGKATAELLALRIGRVHGPPPPGFETFAVRSEGGTSEVIGLTRDWLERTKGPQAEAA